MRRRVALCVGTMFLLASCASSTAQPTTTLTVVAPSSTVGPTLPNAEAPASPLLVGDGRPTMPEGRPNAVSAIPIGAPEPGKQAVGAAASEYVVVPFVVWNTTSGPSEGLKLEVTAVDPSNGKRYDGQVGAMTPNHLEPGQWGLAIVQFLSAPSLPAGTRYDVTFTEGDFVMSRAVDLTVSGVTATPVDGRRTATVTNTSSLALGSPFTAAVYCFDGDQVVSTQLWLADAANNGFTFTPGMTATISFATDPACRSFLVGAVTGHQ